MLLILGFAETSNASEPIFAQGQGGPLGWVGSLSGDHLNRLLGVSRWPDALDEEMQAYLGSTVSS